MEITQKELVERLEKALTQLEYRYSCLDECIDSLKDIVEDEKQMLADGHEHSYLGGLYEMVVTHQQLVDGIEKGFHDAFDGDYE